MYNAWLTGAAVVSRFQRPNLKNCLNCLPLPSGISVTRRPKRMWTCSGPFCRLRFRRSLGVSIRDSHRRPSSLTASWSASADQTHSRARHQQDPSAGNSRVAFEYRSQYVPNAISGTSGHRSSTPMIAFNWQVSTDFLLLCACVRWHSLRKMKMMFTTGWAKKSGPQTP